MAHLVWAAFGDVANYVEPFYGSGAVLLARPTQPRIETVNDRDGMVANFWRAVQVAPDEVAQWADWPVSEVDLHARHRWLVARIPELTASMMGDPDTYDAKVAGWWCWGLCCWIGGGWCRTEAPAGARGKRPKLGGTGVGTGVHSDALGWISAQIPDVSVNDGAAGRGVVSSGLHRGKLPMTATSGAGVHRTELHRKRPDLGGRERHKGKGVHSDKGRALEAWMLALAERLRRVRVCCGDFERVLGPAVVGAGSGTTGVFLDPPYSGETGRSDRLYSVDDLAVAHRAREWALAHGDQTNLRIALCGYEGEHEMPPGWRKVAWTAHGGYAGGGPRRGNKGRERIWFSPGCLSHHPHGDLFAGK